MRRICLLSIAAAALACGRSKPASSDGGGPPGPSGFLHASGTSIVDAAGNPVFLRGVSLGNEVWSNVALPDDHAEVDFARLNLRQQLELLDSCELVGGGSVVFYFVPDDWRSSSRAHS